MDGPDLAGVLAAGLQIYLQTARRTGRTSRMLDRLKDGDQVVTLSSREADRLRRLAKERKLDVRIVTVSEPHPGAVLATVRTAPRMGHTYFDHLWVEAFFERAIADAARDLDQLESATSGWQTAHELTLDAAKRARRDPGRWLFERNSK